MTEVKSLEGEVAELLVTALNPYCSPVSENMCIRHLYDLCLTSPVAVLGRSRDPNTLT